MKSLRHFRPEILGGGLALIVLAVLAIGFSQRADSQPAPTLGVVRQLDASTYTSNNACTRSLIGGCGQKVGFDKAALVNTEGNRVTYRAAIVGLVPAASPTDVFYIEGSASKTIRVTKVTLTGRATAVAGMDVRLIKHSTANSGGTCATVAAVPLINTDAAATANVKSCTANPTPGTAIGDVFDEQYFLGNLTTGVSGPPLETNFGREGGKPVTLSGTAQGLAVNLNGVTQAGNVVQITLEWSEE